MKILKLCPKKGAKVGRGTRKMELNEETEEVDEVYTEQAVEEEVEEETRDGEV
jgi:hypothetical protein